MNTIRRILAATDFSPAGRAAVGRAGQLAAQHGAELHVIHATPDWNLFAGALPVRQQHYDEITHNAELALNKEMAWLFDIFAVQARGEVQRGRASHTIMRAIERCQPNLLVIGARGEHAPGGDPGALGGTTLKLMSHVTLPLLLVREPKLESYSVSLAAVPDTREHSRRIVHWASALVKSGSCHIVRAFQVPYIERLRLCSISDSDMALLAEQAERSITQATQELVSAVQERVKAQVHVLRGTPLPVILGEIARIAPQLIAVGRHEYEPHDIVHAPLACVGVRVAYHSPVDVLIVP